MNSGKNNKKDDWRIRKMNDKMNEKHADTMVKEFGKGLQKIRETYNLKDVHYVLTILTPSDDSGTEARTVSSIDGKDQLYKALRLIGHSTYVDDKTEWETNTVKGKIIGDPIWVSTQFGQIGILLHENETGKRTLRIGQIAGDDIKRDIRMIVEWGAKFPIEKVMDLIILLIKQEGKKGEQMEDEKNEKKKDDKKPNHHDFPIEFEVFERIMNEAYREIVQEFKDEVKLKERMRKSITDYINKELSRLIEQALKDSNKPPHKD